MVLAIYEQSFLGCLYQFRPERHQTLQLVQSQTVKIADWTLCST
jgi:hypothetical protein